MEYCLQYLLNCLMIVVLQKTPLNPWLQIIFRELYIYIYIYLLLSLLLLLLLLSLLLYNCSILDIEHSPYYIALGSTFTHRVI